MVLTSFQQGWCISVINKIMSMPISSPFRLISLFLPSDCGRNVYEILKNPIDLNTILQNVKDNKYDRMVEWEYDVNLIWENAKILYHEKSPQFAMALDLEKWFKKKTKNYPRTKDELWLNKFEKARDKLRDLVNNCPEEIKRIKREKEERQQEKEYEEYLKNNNLKRNSENRAVQQDKKKPVNLFPPDF